MIFLANFFELASLATSLFLIKSIKKQGWLLLVVYLLYTCLVDGLAAYYKYVLHQKNVWLYNPYIILSFAFYSWILITGMNSKLLRKWLYIIVGSFCVTTCAWYIGWGNPKAFISTILTTGSFLIIVLVLLFFYSMLQARQHNHVITEVPLFWIATGLLFFYIGISLSNAMYSYLSKVNIRILKIPLHNLIPQFLSVILYSCIIIAIIKCRKIRAT
jgi:hypothetical protein